MDDKKHAGRIPLIRLPENRKAKVSEITGGANLRGKLMSMGVYEGRELFKLSCIGLRGPVVVRVGRSVVAMGYGMAAKIMVDAL